MDSPVALSPSTQLLLDALTKRFDELGKQMDACFAKWKQPASPSAPTPFPSPTSTTAAPAPTASTTKFREITFLNSGSEDVAQEASKGVIADNWGSLFDGGDDSGEQQYKDLPIVADNWGWLFDQPAHILEERDLESADQIRIAGDLTSAEPEEQSAKEFIGDDHDLAPPRPVNFDTPPFGLALDAAATTTSSPAISTTLAPLFSISNTTPARCSSVGHSHDERTPAPVSTAVAVTPSPAAAAAAATVSYAILVGHDSEHAMPQRIGIDDDNSHSPTRCLTNCLSPEDESTITIPILCSSDSLCCDTYILKPSYLTNSVAAYSIDRVFPCLDNKMHDIQNVSEELSAHYSVMLLPLHAQALDTGQLGSTFRSPFNFGSGTAQPRQPWPPPVPIEFVANTIVFGCSSTTFVFDRGRNRMLFGEMIAVYQVMLKPVSPTLVDKGLDPYLLNSELVDVSPKLPWHVVYLKADSANGNFNSQICFDLWLWFSGDWVTGQRNIQFKIVWVPFCDVQCGMLGHLFTQYLQHQLAIGQVPGQHFYHDQLQLSDICELQFCLYELLSVLFAIADIYKLDQSKCAIFWLLECSDCGTVNISGQCMLLVILQEFLQFKYYWFAHDWPDTHILTSSIVQFKSGNNLLMAAQFSMHIVQAILGLPISSALFASCLLNQENFGGSWCHITCAIISLKLSVPPVAYSLCEAVSLCEQTLGLSIVWAADGSNRNIRIFEHIVVMMQEYNFCFHGQGTGCKNYILISRMLISLLSPPTKAKQQDVNTDTSVSALLATLKGVMEFTNSNTRFYLDITLVSADCDGHLLHFQEYRCGGRVDGNMSCVILPFSSISVHQTKMQVTDKLNSLLIAKLLSSPHRFLLAGCRVKIKTECGINTKYLQVPWEPG